MSAKDSAQGHIPKDMTERRQMEKELRRREATSRAILESSPVAVVEAGANGNITFVNSMTEKLFGYDKGELIGEKVEVLLPDRFTGLHPEYRHRFFSNPQIRPMGIGRDLCGKRKNGSEFPIEVGLNSVETSDGITVLAFVSDISERKDAEQKQAELLAEVESINRELKDFAHIVSHDLKAPLRGIKSLVSWLMSDYADKLDEEGKKQMNMVQSRVDRMHNLIDGVLAYSRVAHQSEERAQVELNELVADVIEMLAAPENISITVSEELPTIDFEPTRIAQVFQNLLGNAIKYMDKPQGQISVGCVAKYGFWKFSVTDNGPGIEEAHFERIFQMFQTLSARDEFESTGVGLTVIKKIVEMYGGKIWVESEPGQGSTFYFTVPKQKTEVTDARIEANIAR